MTRPILGLGFLLALGACAELRQGEGGERTAALGACGADDHQDWVGQRIDALNNVELPPGARVLFPTTPATMDFNPERLNVGVDSADTITRVYCG
jgi:peptidase inhibitor I78 family protein